MFTSFKVYNIIYEFDSSEDCKIAYELSKKYDDVKIFEKHLSDENIEFWYYNFLE